MDTVSLTVSSKNKVEYTPCSFLCVCAYTYVSVCPFACRDLTNEVKGRRQGNKGPQGWACLKGAQPKEASTRAAEVLVVWQALSCALTLL